MGGTPLGLITAFGLVAVNGHGPRFASNPRSMPQPRAFNCSIAATSSGVRISSPRGTSARGELWHSCDLTSSSQKVERGV
jgi:hypothetical protein